MTLTDLNGPVEVRADAPQPQQPGHGHESEQSLHEAHVRNEYVNVISEEENEGDEALKTEPKLLIYTLLK